MRVYYKQVQLNPTQETDYTDLANKPAINGVELEGDLSTEQIKVTWHGTQAEFDALPSVDPYTFYIIDDGIPVGMQESYLNLSDKPSINGQVLTGNKVSADLNMYTSDEVDNIIASMRAIKVVTALPAAPAVNTMYYVGPDSEGVYQVYLFDSLLNRIDLGPSVQKLYTAGNAIGINETTSVISVKYDGTSIRTNTNNELYVPELMGSEGSGINPVYLDNGELKASAGTVGHSIKPIYLNNGKFTEVTHVTSGQYERGVPYIAGGVMLTGNTIQMHQPADSDSTQWGNIQLDATAGSVNLWNNNYNNKQKGAILTVNGDQMKNDLFASATYNNGATGRNNMMIMNGAYEPMASNASTNTLNDIVEELRMTNGAMGSLNLKTEYTDSVTGITIKTGWYHYTYIPHRNGGVNGTAGGTGDNVLYGTLMMYSFRGNQAFPNNYQVSIARSDNTYNIVARQLVDSFYIDQHVPFIISGPKNWAQNSGNLTRSFTSLDGKTATLQLLPTNKGVVLSGSLLSDAIAVKQTTYMSFSNRNYNTWQIHNITNGQNAYLGLTTTIIDKNTSTFSTSNYWQKGPSNAGFGNFNPYGTTISSVQRFSAEIVWTRQSQDTNNLWWEGKGKWIVETAGGSSGIEYISDVILIAQASSVNNIPSFFYGDDGVNNGLCNTTFEIFRANAS